jgi:hypothetical protein
MSSVSAALAGIDAFEADTFQNVAWFLDRTDTLNRIRALVRNPALIDQRGLNACAPAIFFRVWFARDPEAAATFACTLMRDGVASIGSLQVAPSRKLLAQRYALLRSAIDGAHPGATPEGADWMLLSGLRDSENVWFDYAGEPYTAADAVAGLTLPSTLAGWLSATNLYSSVENDTNIISSGDPQKLLSQIPTSGVDVLLLVNAAAIYVVPAPTGQAPAADLFVVPNHYVLMTAPFALWNDPAWIKIECWSWGKTYAGWQGAAKFGSNYFGLVIPKV